MRNRKSWVIIGICILVAIIFWMCASADTKNADDVRFERWRDIPILYKRSVWWKKHLPNELAQLFHLSTLPQNYFEERKKLEVLLLASGYLTNVTANIPMTNSTQVAAAVGRIRKADQAGNDWEISIRTNSVIIICRPQDELKYRQALQQ